jgi:internalin A
MPEWYVSYARGDDRTPEGRTREETSTTVCKAGYCVTRRAGLGDNISTFMNRSRVFEFLSDKYLRSPHCMFELSEVWRTSRQEGEAFLGRMRIYALSNIFKPTDWADWAIHWKQEHDALESRAQTSTLLLSLVSWGTDG